MGKTKEEIRRIQIFSKNLNKYILESGKQQNQIAKDLGFPTSTINTWCVGKGMPKSVNIQTLADYFGIARSDLTDETPSYKETSIHVKILNLYDNLSEKDKEFIMYLLKKLQ